MFWFCGMHLWLREVKWLNNSREITCNNRNIDQWPLIISEYSKHPHSEASQKLQIRVRINLLMILWLLSCICSAVSWKCSTFHKRNFIVLICTHNYQNTSISRLSQISLNFYCSAFLSLGFVDRQIDFIFREFNIALLEICHSTTHIVPVSSHSQYTFTLKRNTKEANV